MKILNKEFLESGVCKIEHNKNGSSLPEKVLQFGEGNFLRAFIDWMIDEMNAVGAFNGRVVLVQPLENGLIEMINEQNGLYTLLQRGILNGETVDSKKVITSISRGIDPYKNWQDFLLTAHNPEMELVVSNTTEAGIEYVEEPFEENVCPKNFPAKLTRWLFERFTVFSGDSEKGVIILPCELINHNGDELKACVKKFAEAWKFDAAFMNWVNESCTFLSTLVDRIVPGYPRDEVEKITNELGYRDNLIDTGEIFHLLVVEGANEKIQKKLQFSSANLNVIFTDDMQPYRTRKVAILNGAHTGSVLGAYLAGLDTVGEMLNDSDFSQFLKKMMLDEIVPTLDLPEDEKLSYAEAILERFSNPFVRHELLSISLNSVSKWKVRVLPSLKKYIEINGEIPKRLAFSLAALIAFYKGGFCASGDFIGARKSDKTDDHHGVEIYKINDSKEVIDFFAELKSVDDSVSAVLGNVNFWGEDLNELIGLTEFVTANLNAILSVGSRAAMQELI